MAKQPELFSLTLVRAMTDTLTKTFTAPTGHTLRSTLIDGEPWFVAVDLARALGLEINAGSGQHMSRLRHDERRRENGITLGLTQGGRGNPNINLVSESGLYKLALRSDKDTATTFQDWVTGEVLPSIRKTGSYALADHGRTEMPLPTEFAAAMREMAAANAACATFPHDPAPLGAVENITHSRKPAPGHRMQPS